MDAALAERGMDRASVMKGLERNLVVGKYINDNITGKITVSPEEVAEYYKAHTEEFRHPTWCGQAISDPGPGGSSPEQDRLARQRIEAILVRARKGEDFAKLAQEVSMDSSASEGGDLGFTSQGQLDPAYDAVAFSLRGRFPERSGALPGRLPHYQGDRTGRRRGLPPWMNPRAQLTEFLKSERSNCSCNNLSISCARMRRSRF